ncbi:uncharacterized protein LOC143283923 [Babylonia areolata]|uniref:uncharacterized protein LOC143283923 n=1 Tax=Babylonia areolata TaxID=304850 RepID=UPI003FD2D04B
MKEKLLDKDTIDAYHSYVQSEIRSDLNSICLGPGKLPSRAALGLTVFGLCCLLVGVLLICLRMNHVYLWDWEDQFVGPFFIILFLMCFAGATYFVLIATRRSNRFRREIYFRPLGDYGIAAVHKDDLLYETEMKHDLKSGTTPHKTVMPRSEAYSAVNISKEKRSGHHNQGYRYGPEDSHRRGHDPHRRPPGPDRRPHPDDRRRGPPPDGRRGPPPDDRDRRRPPEGRRGPPPDDYRRGPPRDDRRGGPPSDYRRGPPPEGFRGPPPEGRRGPPPGGYRDDRRGPPPDRRGPPPDRRGPPPERRGSPPPDDRRPRGPPQFRERSPDDDLGKVRLEDNRESESDL